jgi:hypothetical protein
MRGFVAFALFAAAVSAEQAALTEKVAEPLTGGGYNDQLVKRAMSVNPVTAADALKKIRGDPVLLKKLERAQQEKEKKKSKDPEEEAKALLQDYRDKFRTIRICAAGMQSWATDWKERITAIRLAPGFVVDGIKSMNEAKIYLPASFYIIAEYFTLSAKILSYWLGSIASSWTFMSYQWHSQYMAWWATDEDWRMRQDMGILDGKYIQETTESADAELKEHRPEDYWGFTKKVAKLMNNKDYKTSHMYSGVNKFWMNKDTKFMPSAGKGNGWGIASMIEIADEKVAQPAPLVEAPNPSMPAVSDPAAPPMTIAQMAEVAQKGRQQMLEAMPAVNAAAQVPVNVAAANQVVAAKTNSSFEEAAGAAFGANFFKALSDTKNSETHLPSSLPDSVQSALIKLNQMPAVPASVLEQFKKNKVAVQKADGVIASFRENLSVLGCAISDLMERQANGFDQMKCVHNELLEFSDVGFYVPDYILEKIKNNHQNFRYLWLWFSKIFVTPESGYTFFQGLLSYMTNYLAIVAAWIGGIGFTTTGFLAQPDVYDTFWTKPVSFPGTTPMIPAAPAQK